MMSVKLRRECKELAVQELQILFRLFARKPTTSLLWLVMLRCEAFVDEFGERVPLEVLREESDS